MVCRSGQFQGNIHHGNSCVGIIQGGGSHRGGICNLTMLLQQQHNSDTGSRILVPSWDGNTVNVQFYVCQKSVNFAFNWQNNNNNYQLQGQIHGKMAQVFQVSVGNSQIEYQDTIPWTCILL